MEKRLLGGLWKTNITPPINFLELDDNKIKAERLIQEDVYVNSLVIDDNSKEVAIVSVDIIMIPYDIVKDVIYRIEKYCGIPSNNITISATHTHQSPNVFLDGFHSDIFTNADPVYVEHFKKCIITSVYMAKKNKSPIEIGVGKDKNKNHVFNRRLKKPEGDIVMNWTENGFLQDCIGDGVVDPEMIVLKIDNYVGKTIGFLINYSNHNNAVPGNVISPDISGYLGKLLKKIYGEEVVIIFLTGACGNVNWINYKDIKKNTERTELYRKIATGMTGTALTIVGAMEHPKVTHIEALSRTLVISERPFEEYDTKEDLTYGVEQAAREGFFNNMHKRAKIESEGKELSKYDVEIHAIKIGNDIAIITNPGEYFADYAINIKKKSPFKYTIIAELTNGAVGYIPTDYAYKEGGYEVRKPANLLEKDAGIRIENASVEMLNKLYALKEK